MKQSPNNVYKDSADEEQGRLSSNTGGAAESNDEGGDADHDQNKYLLDEVHQLKLQQARQHDDFCALQSFQEDSMNTLRDEIRALELKIAGLMTKEETILFSNTRTNSRNDNNIDNDDFSINPVVHGAFPREDSFNQNHQLGPPEDEDSSMFHHPQQLQQSQSTRTLITGITETRYDLHTPQK